MISNQPGYTAHLGIYSHLRESSGGVSLVRLDDISSSELNVGVGGVDNLTSIVVDDREGGEAIAITELAAPAGGDGVVAASGRATVGLGGIGGIHDEGAGSSGGGSDLNAKGPGALAVGRVASALHVLDGPLSISGHHGDAGSRSGHDGRGGEEGGGKEDLGELHDCDVVVYWRCLLEMFIERLLFAVE